MNMKKLVYQKSPEFFREIERPVLESGQLREIVEVVLNEVKRDGDSALIKYTRHFDQMELKELRVSGEKLVQSAKSVDQKLRSAIDSAAANIRKFHASQALKEDKVETTSGVTCWRESRPINSVGFYIPGGSAPLFSTVLMLGIPADLAGCQRKVLCTPPDKNGLLNPAIAYAASICGIEEVFLVGGIQAIGAMAYGTESVKKVQKIFGPGNQYVTAAKERVALDGIAIDMPAGPSELLVYADGRANSLWVATDLLSQAEHGPDSQVILVTSKKGKIEEIEELIQIEMKRLPRREIAEKALQNSVAIEVQNDEEALALINEYAPEHLILSTQNARQLAGKVQNAGSVFIGYFSPESAGDYASGTNHTLPTNGLAKAYSGVSLDSFVKKITFQELTSAGLQALSGTIMEMASAELLEAHKRAVEVRTENQL